MAAAGPIVPGVPRLLLDQKELSYRHSLSATRGQGSLRLPIIKATTSERHDMMTGGKGGEKTMALYSAGSDTSAWRRPPPPAPELSGAQTTRERLLATGGARFREKMELSVDVGAGSVTHREFRISGRYSDPSPRKAAGLQRELASPISTRPNKPSVTATLYCMSPVRHPPKSPPYKLFSVRSSKLETIPRERPVPWSLGELAPSVCETPGLHVNRWPAAATSNAWRYHGQGLRCTFHTPWYSGTLTARTPRGPPAPGGHPCQYPRPPRTAGATEKHERPPRPFTNASAEAAHVLFREACALKANDEAAASERQLGDVLRIEPNHAGALAMLGTIHKDERFDYPRAETMYRRCLLIQPENTEALAGLAALVENVHEDTKEADRLYQRALEKTPDDVNLLASYALFVKRVFCDHSTARRYILDALKRNPDHPWLRENAHKF